MSEIYDLLIPEERKVAKTGEVKTYFHRVGSAFAHRKGEGYNLVIPAGVSISGRVLMLKRAIKGEGSEQPDPVSVQEFHDNAGQPSA